MKIWIVFDWAIDQPMGVYSTGAKAWEVWEKRMDFDIKNGNTDCAWGIAALELDAEPDRDHQTEMVRIVTGAAVSE